MLRAVCWPPRALKDTNILPLDPGNIRLLLNNYPDTIIHPVSIIVFFFVFFSKEQSSPYPRTVPHYSDKLNAVIKICASYYRVRLALYTSGRITLFKGQNRRDSRRVVWHAQLSPIVNPDGVSEARLLAPRWCFEAHMHCSHLLSSLSAVCTCDVHLLSSLT